MLGMLKNVLGNVFSKPATRMYPFETREPFKDARGHLQINKEECTLCGICQLKCPAGCLEVDQKKGTWQLNPFQCVICGVCVEKCPWDCLSLENHYYTPGVKGEISVEPPAADFQSSLVG